MRTEHLSWNSLKECLLMSSSLKFISAAKSIKSHKWVNSSSASPARWCWWRWWPWGGDDLLEKRFAFWSREDWYVHDILAGSVDYFSSQLVSMVSSIYFSWLGFNPPNPLNPLARSNLTRTPLHLLYIKTSSFRMTYIGRQWHLQQQVA